MENPSYRAQSSDEDSQEYVEFCRNCGLFLADGLQLWREALKAMGISARTIEVKLSAAAELIRRRGHSA
jgi:hypothetical protein